MEETKLGQPSENPETIEYSSTEGTAPSFPITITIVASPRSLAGSKLIGSNDNSPNRLDSNSPTELPIDAKQIFSSSSSSALSQKEGEGDGANAESSSTSASDSDSDGSSSEDGVAEMGGLDYNEADVDPFDADVEQYAYIIPKADTIDINKDNKKIEKSSISAAVYHLLHMSVDRDDENFLANMSFLRGFIWNFDLFISPSKLMQIIIVFYRIRMNQDDSEAGKRLIGFLAELVNARFASLETCKPFKRLFLQFFTFLDRQFHANGQFIMNTWTANQNKELNFKTKFDMSQIFGTEPLPIQTSFYSVTEFSPLTTAQVFSEINQVLFFNITMIEFRAWSTRKKNPDVDFSNIDRLIDWFNQVTCYVRTTLVVPLTMTVKEQVHIYSHWIKVMQYMVEQQNFEGIAPIFFGLSSPSAVSKLEALLPKDLKQAKQNMEALVGPAHNYLIYRSTFEKNINKLSPYVPQQCVLLKDLTCLEENKTILKGKVHWFKLTLVGEILDSIRLARSRRYNFWQNNTADHYIGDIFIFLANGYRNRLQPDKFQEVVDVRSRLTDTLPVEKKTNFNFLDKTASNPIMKAMTKRDSLGTAERRKRDSGSEDLQDREPKDGSLTTSPSSKKKGQTHVRRASDSLGLDLSENAINAGKNREKLSVSSGSGADMRRRLSNGSSGDIGASQTSSEGISPRPESPGHSAGNSPSRAVSSHLTDSSQEVKEPSNESSPLSPGGKKKEKISTLDKVIRYVSKPNNTNTPKIVEPGDRLEIESYEVGRTSKSSSVLHVEFSEPKAVVTPKDGTFGGVHKSEEKMRRNRSLSDVTSIRRPTKK